MRVIFGRAVALVFAIVFVAGLHGTEVLTAAQAETVVHDCGCSTECACRGPETGCSCSLPELTMKGRCGCGGTGPHDDAATASWDTLFAPACSLGAPLLMWSPASELSDLQAWRLPFEHEHPPRSLPPVFPTI